MGEMPLYYATADLALMGGSFAPLGGQNLIEACACACPVLLGPHTFNFAQASEQAIAAGAALRCNSMEQAVQQALALLSTAPAETGASDSTRAAMQRAALVFSQAHRGAAIAGKPGSHKHCADLVGAGLLAIRAIWSVRHTAA